MYRLDRTQFILLKSNKSPRLFYCSNFCKRIQPNIKNKSNDKETNAQKKSDKWKTYTCTNFDAHTPIALSTAGTDYKV